MSKADLLPQQKKVPDINLAGGSKSGMLMLEAELNQLVDENKLGNFSSTPRPPGRFRQEFKYELQARKGRVKWEIGG